MQNKLPGLLGLVVTRARQRSWHSINEAARIRNWLTGAGAASLSRVCESKEKGRGILLFCWKFTAGTRSREQQAPVFGKGLKYDQKDLHQHQGAVEAAKRQQRLRQA